MLLRTPGKDLRLIAVISDINDRDINELHSEDMDKEPDYNGLHSNLDDKFLFQNKMTK